VEEHVQQILSLRVWDSVAKLAKKASPRIAAVAYVSTSDLVKFGKGDLLVVDASDAAIKSGATSAAALKAFVRRHAEVVSVTGLHSKVLALGNTAVIGSANISQSSKDDLIEAAVITTSPSLVSGIKSLVFQLAESGMAVDQAFLSRISKLPVVRHFGPGGKRSPRLRIGTLGGSTWIVGVRELADDAYPTENQLAESGFAGAKEKRTYRNSQVSWIRFVGNGNFRTQAREGDLTIQVWRPLGRGAVEVFPHATILRRQDEGEGRTRFYLEERPRSGNHTLSLMGFRTLLRKHGFSAKVGQNSARRIDPLLSDAIRSGWK
jgi:hypothetical protein